MSRQDVSTDIRALRRDARSANPLFDCSDRVYILYCEWRCGTDFGMYMSPEDQAAVMLLIAEVLENPQ